MTKLVNLTPHAIVILNAESQEVMTLPPSGSLARAKETVEILGTVEVGGGAVPIRRKTVGGLEGLPAAEEGTLYVVSFIAAQAGAKEGRSDLLITDDAVRDAQGKIIGCRAFSRL